MTVRGHSIAWLLPFLLFLHVLGAIAGFGPSFVFPIVGAMGGEEREHANFATRVSHSISARAGLPDRDHPADHRRADHPRERPEPLDRANWWLGLAIVLYVIAYGYSFFVQRRRSSDHRADVRPPPAGATGPPPELMASQAGPAGREALTVLLPAIIFLMVVKPQF